jgi:UDP-3-O-[3-hydroxymyristoyl] N-acetylglucosamine deacetylase
LGHQRTLQREIECVGIGLHTGARVAMRLRPAPAHAGIVFRRIDLAGAPPVAACPANIRDVHYATTIGRDGITVGTVEHLLAAFAGTGLDNVTVDLAGPEVPAMDGSALPFVELVRAAGLRRQLAPRSYLKVRRPIVVELDSRSVRILPAERLSVAYAMAFDHPAVRPQVIAFEMNPALFAREIAPARTYGFLRDVEGLRRQGLALGGSLDNAVVVGEDGVLNEDGLRFPDEMVRHKALDLIGDLFLLGKRILGRVIATGAGHLLHAQLVREIQAQLDLEAGRRPRPAAIEPWVAPLFPATESLEAASA